MVAGRPRRRSRPTAGRPAAAGPSSSAADAVLAADLLDAALRRAVPSVAPDQQAATALARAARLAAPRQPPGAARGRRWLLRVAVLLNGAAAVQAALPLATSLPGSGRPLPAARVVVVAALLAACVACARTARDPGPPPPARSWLTALAVAAICWSGIGVSEAAVSPWAAAQALPLVLAARAAGTPAGCRSSPRRRFRQGPGAQWRGSPG